jgi:biofilm PGA synthesis protein PgaA
LALPRSLLLGLLGPLGLIALATAAPVTGTAPALEPGRVLSPSAAEALYRNAINEARAGQLAHSLSTLHALVERFPARQDMLGDYVVVLGWAADDTAALALLTQVRLAEAPPYVIESLAHSARRLQRYTLAETLYRDELVRFPGRLEAQLGQVRLQLDTHDIAGATTAIAALRARFPAHVEVLIVFAEVALARRDYFAALTTYQAVLTQQPEHREALRGKIRTLGLLGAPQLALELAARHPGLLDTDAHDAIAVDQTAQQIRWGTIAADTGHGPARFATLDQALAASDLAGAHALDPARVLSPAERQLALDRISALRERYRMREAVVLYEALAARGEPMPGYAQSAAASAYLYLEQPEKARDLYRAALANDAHVLEANVGLFFALSEGEEQAAARVQIEHAVAITPQWIDAWSPATRRDNPAYARVLSARAMAPLLANRPGDAEQQLHALSDQVPYNMAVRTDYASSLRARGWPRAADQELQWVQAVDPDNSSAAGERAGALLEMRDYHNSQAMLASAQALAAEDGRVVRAARLWQVHTLRELIVDGTYGQSNGGPTGTQDHAIDARLYSSPFNENYRAFAHTFNARAKFDDGVGARDRAGVGLEYRSPLMTATGEVAHNLNGSKSAAASSLAGSLAFTPDDYWTVRGAYEKSSNQTPLQATRVGVDADRAVGEVLWRASESRRALVGLEKMDFTDGNRREISRAQWTERVIAGPVYKLEITGGLYASQNSRRDTGYFNPAHDFSPTVEFANEWLQWRRYTRAFRHRLVASVGSYTQDGFGTGSVYGVRYEQEWEADDRLTFRYGIGRSQHPYDGVQTDRTYGYFYLNGKF